MNQQTFNGLLSKIERFHAELTAEARRQQTEGYDPPRWSAFSQDWNRRQREWRVEHGLMPGSQPYNTIQGFRSLTAASIALFTCWTAYHQFLDFERTRPKGLARLLRRGSSFEEIREAVGAAQEIFQIMTDAARERLDVPEDAPIFTIEE